MPTLKSDSVRLQDRDLTLLRGLFECRVMTIGHAAVLHFEGKGEAAKKRLQKLKAAGLIGERPRRIFDLSTLFLARKGLELLQKHGILAEYPSFDLPVLERRARVSDRTVQHELEVMDIKSAFHTAIRKSPIFTVDRFSTWPKLHEFKAYRLDSGGMQIDVKPDGFIRIHEKETGTKGFFYEYFLEVDRSTEQLDILVNRAGAYLNYYRSGGYAVRNGVPHTAFKDFPFRVLIVLKTADRRNNLAEMLSQNIPPILTQTWLTTREEVVSDPLGAVWILPKDYRDTTKGTPFYNDRPNYGFAYQRQSERDAFVEAKVLKRKLLEATSEGYSNEASTNLTKLES